MQSITEVADGVHCLSEGGINFYVVDEGGRLTLIDAGLPGHWETFSTWLRRTGRAPRDIEAVLITHHHSDHVGFAGQVLEHSAAEVYVHADDVRPAEAGQRPQLPPRLLRNVWRPRTIARAAGWVARGITRSVLLPQAQSCRDGERLDVPGSPTVLHVPGHTPGSAAFVFADHGVVCTGDALVTLDLTSGRRGVGISPSGLNDDDDLALASLDRLAQLDIPDAVLLPGHGAPYPHGMPSAISAARSIGAHWSQSSCGYRARAQLASISWRR